MGERQSAGRRAARQDKRIRASAAKPLRPRPALDRLADFAPGSRGRGLCTGLVLLIVKTATGAAATAAPVLFAAQGVGGLGYLPVVIAAPTMIVAATASGRERDGAMVV